VVNRGRVLGDVYDSGFPQWAGTVAVIWQLAVLAQVLVYLHDFRQPGVVLAVWLGLLGAAAWLVPRSRAGGLNWPQASGAIAIAVAAVLLVGWERRAQSATGSVDWSVFGTGWLLALVAASRPARDWVCGALLVFAAHTVVFIHVVGLATPGLARLAATAYTLVMILVAFAALRTTFRTHAQVAARRAALASRSAAERAAARAIGTDRLARLALLEAQVLPLLRGIADGAADPADDRVRAQCRDRAAALRRALVDRTAGRSPLLTELEPALRAAAARGLPVEIQVVGDPGRPGPQVAVATRRAVERTLAALPLQPVVLTVLDCTGAVELYLVFDTPPSSPPDLADLRAGVPAPIGWDAAVDIDDCGGCGGCLEVRWRQAAG
jgi:hypothetical protein